MADAEKEIVTPDTWAEKFERINLIRETNGHFDSYKTYLEWPFPRNRKINSQTKVYKTTSRHVDSFSSCKRLGTSRLHDLHDSKFLCVTRIEFIRSKLSISSAHVSGVCDSKCGTDPPTSAAAGHGEGEEAAAGARGQSGLAASLKRSGSHPQPPELSQNCLRKMNRENATHRHEAQIYSGEDIRGQCITLYRVAFRTGHVLRGHWESVPRDWGAGVDPRNSAAKGSSRSAKEMVLFDTWHVPQKASQYTV